MRDGRAGERERQLTVQASPIFVCGAGRSGTTMLGTSLGRHSACVAIPEATFVADALRRFHPIERADARELLEFVARSPRHRVWETPLDTDAVGDDELGTTLADVVRFVVRSYASAHERARFARWIDHTPLNVKHAAALFRLFPDAHMVHLVRDGRAVAASVLPLDWGPDSADAAARSWLISLALGFAAEEAFGPERVRRVRYEDVVLEPEATLRDICSWAGLEYENAMVEGDGDGGLTLPRHTHEQHRLVGAAPDRTRIDAWRQRLSARQVEQIEAVTAQMLEHLGYEPVYGNGARPRSRAERRADTWRALWHDEVTNRWRRWRRWRR